MAEMVVHMFRPAANCVEGKQEALVDGTMVDVVLPALSASFDLVAVTEEAECRSRRIFSSPTHLQLLGHDPASCNGD